MLRFLKKICKLVFAAAVVTVLLQNPLIFPGAPHDFLFSPQRIAPPPGVDGGFVNTSDGEKLEFWRLPRPSDSTKKQVAIILHGNFGDLDRFFYVQKDFQSMGYTSYGLDYRGYGKSTGWPTEEGLYQDAEALWRAALIREKVSPQDVVLVGVSLGSGPAMYLAERYHPKTLLLVAPYTSIPDVVRERMLLQFLAPFVWIHFPNEERMPNISDVCVVATHGEKDRKISIENSKRLQAAYGKGKSFTLVVDAEADHNGILPRAWSRVSQAVQTCAESIAG